MMFCPKCGSILLPRKDKNTTILACKCGYVNKKAEVEPTLKEKVKSDVKKVEVVGNEEDNTLPLTKADCPKCSHDMAFYWTVQTRAADEAETKFLKCQK